MARCNCLGIQARTFGATRCPSSVNATPRPVRWNKRPLVWVTGKETKADRVPAQDFVFAALKLAVDEHETWTAPVTVLYRRAAANVGALCKAFETFGLASEIGCR